MNLLEAKRFEYFINGFKKELESRQNAKDNDLPTYKILWESNNKLFFCNTYLPQTAINFNMQYYSASSSKDLYFFGKFDNAIKDTICNKSSVNTKTVNIESMRLYKNSLLFFDYVNYVINEFSEFPDDLDQTTIFNVQKFNSGKGTTLDFLRVEDGFTLKPVSLIENLDKE